MNRPGDSSSTPTAPTAPELVGVTRHLHLGQLIAGRYEVRAHLGSGRTGVVYRVHDRDLSEDIALKVLHPELAEQPRELERFRRGVRLARKIAHPNVCRVFDLGEVDGLVFVTMELLPGETLRARIAAGAGSLSERLRLFKYTACGLAAVHAEGILHGDIRPEKVLVREDGTTVVSDLGFAMAPDEIMRFTRYAGSAVYMSPEQLRGEPLNVRSDVFALGLLGYELVTGERPFGKLTPAVVMSATLRDDPVALEIEGLPEWLAFDISRLLSDALAKKSRKRPNAAAMANAVASVLQDIDSIASAASVPKRSVSPVASARYRSERASLLMAWRNQAVGFVVTWLFFDSPTLWWRMRARAIIVALTAPACLLCLWEGAEVFQLRKDGPLCAPLVDPLLGDGRFRIRVTVVTLTPCARFASIFGAPLTPPQPGKFATSLQSTNLPPHGTVGDWRTPPKRKSMDPSGQVLVE